MDPNKALSDLREAFKDASEVLSAGPDAASEWAEVLIPLYDAAHGLDEWLSSGGFPPEAWVQLRATLGRDRVTTTAASHVLAVLDGPGAGVIPPGDFLRDLINALCRADRTNLGRAALGFAEYAAAVNCYKNDVDGLVWLKGKAAEGSRER